MTTLLAPIFHLPTATTSSSPSSFVNSASSLVFNVRTGLAILPKDDLRLMSRTSGASETIEPADYGDGAGAEGHTDEPADTDAAQPEAPSAIDGATPGVPPDALSGRVGRRERLEEVVSAWGLYALSTAWLVVYVSAAKAYTPRSAPVAALHVFAVLCADVVHFAASMVRSHSPASHANAPH
jgi:hypothetical protein